MKYNRSSAGKYAIRKAGRKYRETLKGRSVVIWNDAKTRARNRQIPFTITKEWVIEKLSIGRCAQTGDTFDLTLLNDVKNMFAPSLDQIIPNAGYTPENTQVVCWWWNAFKNNRTDADAWVHFTKVRAYKFSSFS